MCWYLIFNTVCLKIVLLSKDFEICKSLFYFYWDDHFCLLSNYYILSIFQSKCVEPFFHPKNKALLVMVNDTLMHWQICLGSILMKVLSLCSSLMLLLFWCFSLGTVLVYFWHPKMTLHSLSKDLRGNSVYTWIIFKKSVMSPSTLGLFIDETDVIIDLKPLFYYTFQISFSLIHYISIVCL